MAASALAAHVKAGIPVYAWDDPNAGYPAPEGGHAAGEAPVSPGGGERNYEHHHRLDLHHRRHEEVSFFDQTALQQQLKLAKDECLDLSKTEAALKERLARAQAALSAMREKKRNLSEERALGEAVSTILPVRARKARAASVVGPCSDFRERRYREGYSAYNGASGRHKSKEDQRKEDNNFAAMDRVMELELLNEQLRKGQGEAERKAKSEQNASNATRAEMQKVAEKIKAMPKRFTQTLPALRDEVDRLEREKVMLELAKQQRTLKEADLLASAKRQHAYLGEELACLLNEIDDLEEDRERWKRRLRVESTGADTLRSQRGEALLALRQRHGNDAVERAAFAFCARPRRRYSEHLRNENSRERPEKEADRRRDDGGGRWGEGSLDAVGECNGNAAAAATAGGVGRRLGKYRTDGSSSSCADDNDLPLEIPVSMVAKALTPAYGPDVDVAETLTAEAISEAVMSVCGIRGADDDRSAMSKEEIQGLRLGFEEFRAVAERLMTAGAMEHADRDGR